MRKALLIVSVAVFGLSFGGGEQAVSTFTDKRDGKVYRIVEIDGRVWFAENLNYAAEGSRCYGESGVVILVWDKNGDHVTTTLSAAEVQANCAKYGRLYDWDTADTACPAGFRLPTYKEWTALVDYAGGEEKAGTKLKSSTGWNSYDGVPVGTDDFGFSGLPGGSGSGLDDGCFIDAGNKGRWWSATRFFVDCFWDLEMNYREEYVWITRKDLDSQLSVRCVQGERDASIKKEAEWE